MAPASVATTISPAITPATLKTALRPIGAAGGGDSQLVQRELAGVEAEEGDDEGLRGGEAEDESEDDTEHADHQRHRAHRAAVGLNRARAEAAGDAGEEDREQGQGEDRDAAAQLLAPTAARQLGRLRDRFARIGTGEGDDRDHEGDEEGPDQADEET